MDRKVERNPHQEIRIEAMETFFSHLTKNSRLKVITDEGALDALESNLEDIKIPSLDKRILVIKGSKERPLQVSLELNKEIDPISKAREVSVILTLEGPVGEETNMNKDGHERIGGMIEVPNVHSIFIGLVSMTINGVVEGNFVSSRVSYAEGMKQIEYKHRRTNMRFGY